MVSGHSLDAAASRTAMDGDGPLAVAHADRLLTVGWQQRLIVWFLVLGVAARAVRYLLNFPLWEDECFLAVNFIDRSFAELLGPLQYHQVAPPLFLWIELAAVRLLGFSEWSLRLFPFLCAVASLFVFRHLAGRLLSGTPLVLAVATFAAAYPGIRYAAEAKQYASDLFASLVLLCLAVEWWRKPDERRWLWALAAVVPLALLLSYPAVFVAGGISLFLAAAAWRKPRSLRHAEVGLAARANASPWYPWAVYNGLLLAGFAGVFLLGAQNQSRASLEVMGGFWHGAFPPWHAPLELPGWLLATHAGDLLAYPVGGGRGASTLTLLAIVAAIGLLVRQRRWPLLLLALAPFALTFAAASIERYPYGGHVKLSQHLAPAICLLAGLGTAVWIGWLAARRPPLARGLLGAAVLVPALVAAGSIARDVWRPYKTESDLRARAFAQWFWFNAQSDAETLCLKTDLGYDLIPDAYDQLSWSAMYVCNQRIYSPRHRAQQPPQLEQVSATRPLRCMFYRDPRYEHDEEGLARWLAEMQIDYRLVGQRTYAFPRYDKRERQLVTVDYLEEFQFVPRDDSGVHIAEPPAGARQFR